MPTMPTMIERNINPQSRSPFFCKIPPEIRTLIFEHALTAEDDKQNPYSRHSYNYRPGYHYPHKIHTSLLLSCRRIYFEARFVPIKINEHIDWFHRPPPGTREKFQATSHCGSRDSSRAYANCMTDDQQSAINNVHIFTQQFWLEDSWQGQKGWSIFTQQWSNLTQLKITLRHTDWWFWEHDCPLAMDAKKAGDALTGLWIEASDPFEHDSWGYQFRNFQNLKVFKLELETIETKKTELDQIVTHASTWQFMLGNGSIMILNASMTEKTGWIGSHKFIGKAERPRLDNLDIRPQRRSNSISQAYRPVIDRILRRRPQIARGAHSIPLATGEPNPTLLTPRTRLIAAGVKFDTESDPHAATMPYHGLTYYVVNLTWNAAVGSMATN